MHSWSVGTSALKCAKQQARDMLGLVYPDTVPSSNPGSWADVYEGCSYYGSRGKWRVGRRPCLPVCVWTPCWKVWRGRLCCRSCSDEPVSLSFFHLVSCFLFVITLSSSLSLSVRCPVASFYYCLPDLSGIKPKSYHTNTVNWYFVTFQFMSLSLPITVAARSEAWTVCPSPHQALGLSFPKATRSLEPISYRGALLSTLLHAAVYVYTQFAECTGTDCR
jgi:hypothetical protein